MAIGIGRASLLSSASLAALMAGPIGMSARATTFSCVSSGSGQTCTIPAGNYTSAASLNASSTRTSVDNYGRFDVSTGTYAISVNTGSGSGYEFTNYGVLNLTASASANASAIYAPLSLTASGATGSNGIGTSSAPVTATIGGSLLLDDRLTTAAGGLYGVYVNTAGGAGANGVDEVFNDVDPGAGGDAGQIDLTLDGAKVEVRGGSATTSGAVVRASQKGGNGGSSVDDPSGASGGATGTLDATLKASELIGGGTGIAGLQLRQEGGAGGRGDTNNREERSNGASGGSPGQLTLDIPVTDIGSAVSTAGAQAPGIDLTSLGGTGGLGASSEGGVDIDAGNGGAGGTGGAVKLDAQGAVRVSTSGAASPGIALLSQGGAGGDGGKAASYFAGGYSGFGGDGGGTQAVALTLGSGKTGTGSGTLIETSGDSSPALSVAAAGGDGGDGGSTNASSGRAESRDGGKGGSTGKITVDVADGVTLRTAGTAAYGLLVKSAGGLGGNAKQSAGGIDFSSQGGNGGVGGNTGEIEVSSAATIETSGASARGILVQAAAGYGGKGGNATGVISAHSGDGGASGSIGKMTLGNSGAITTRGDGAQGILAQSLGGGGGAGGSSSGSFFYSAGGDGGNSPEGVESTSSNNGGEISLANTGSITTWGATSAGIMAQSIGGGGGDGGSGSGVIAGDGGEGTGGGTGGVINVDAGGSVATHGSLSHGIVAQSIGGGGGNGGNAYSTSVAVGVSVGGTAGNGGGGGLVSVDAANATIQTVGTGASGIVAQSIGDGGGTGGGAYTIVGGISASVAAAVGGAGGSGGNGGNATVTTRQTSIRTGNPDVGGIPDGAVPVVDAMGIQVQSIGGGGGSGGGASARAFAVALPSPKEVVSQKSQTIVASFALGGAAGGGGDGQLARLELGPQTQIQTAGAGSHGVEVQSIGGGGGQGGDASALAGTIGTASQFGKLQQGTLQYNLTVAIGRTGGDGGKGGEASLTAGVASAAESDKVGIATTGDYANGVLVQSIGGGGGNAGLGSTEATYASKVSSIKMGFAIGATGGDGGIGGSASADLLASSDISTSGSGAAGVLVQSIGGGGGNSTGSTVNVSGFDKQKYKINDSLSASYGISVGVGAAGGSGNKGGDVSVANQGRIATAGADAPGIVAQSIGGGGGVGGSPGSDAVASGDATIANPTLPDDEVPSAKLAADGLPGTTIPSLTADFTLSLALGGTGGTGGDAGIVTVQHGGSITTAGDYSPGIFAQSIGGGGGRGGVAVAQGKGNTVSSVIKELKVKSTVALGISGGGGVGGNGKEVNLNLDGGASISTGQSSPTAAGNGFQSFGLFGQSVGGGGGFGADGSVNPNGLLFLGAGLAGSGGGAGSGGAVTLRQSSGGSAIAVRTAGDAAHAIVLQSVGGGGGVAGAGSSLVGNTGIVPYTPTLELKLGGAGASGAGGKVLVDSPILTLGTTGKGAFGILAQSVGGGGGFAAVNGSTSTITQLGGASSSGDGGQVDVNTNASSMIVTAGAGAHGIVAQSVGGGGGIAADTSGALTLTRPSGMGASNGTGNGGAVGVNVNGAVQVSGTNAIGVFAQSIGGGGGFGGDAGGAFAGSTGNAGTGTTKSGGTVTVNQSGTVYALGSGGVGIFAQSQGPSGNGQVQIDVAGTVKGASDGSGAGVLVSAGRKNALTVQSSGYVSGNGGAAVRYVGDRSTAAGSVLDVYNYGTIDGDVLLNNTDSNAAGTVYNYSNNTLNARLVEANVVNTGTVVIGGRDTVGTTRITGNFAQSRDGTLRLDADFGAGRIDHLSVAGNAELDGRVDVRTGNLLPRRLAFLDVGGIASGTLTGISRNVFDFNVAREGNSYTLAVDATFNRPEFGLGGGDGQVAGHLQQIWNAGGGAFGPMFAALASANLGSYTGVLGALRSETINAPAAENVALTQQRLDRAMSCPVFQTGTASLREGECLWGQAGGQRFNQGRFDGAGGYNDTVYTYALGGQKRIAPNWFLGFAAAYEDSRIADATGSRVKIDGQTGSAGLSLKYEIGNWLFAAAVSGNYGSFDSTRIASFAGIGGVAFGTQNLYGLGGRLRAAYTWDLGGFYVRPFVDADLVYTNAGSYNEIGAGLFDRQVAGRSEWAVLASPTLEIGTNLALGGDYGLRAFARAGVTFSSLDAWSSKARLSAAPIGADGFTVSLPMDDIYGRVGAGLQLTSLTNGINLRAEYNGDFSSHATRHIGSLRFSIDF
ncbi:autotransporter [Chelatococcus reniformis]|uniref:Autotransporter n=2 Tax=Chelatococcus reniformis TaxID=1494448 RepID=A0A916XLS6_9HYPH|nr:autotransporter [Chelatococcus reniformis]